MTTRVALYARFSSDLQSRASIEDQLHLCRARAERDGWTIVATFSDVAISGSTILRPGYQAMLASIRAGEVDVVLAESQDRFSRDLEHVAALYKLAQVRASGSSLSPRTSSTPSPSASRGRWGRCSSPISPTRRGAD